MEDLVEHMATHANTAPTPTPTPAERFAARQPQTSVAQPVYGGYTSDTVRSFSPSGTATPFGTRRSSEAGPTDKQRAFLDRLLAERPDATVSPEAYTSKRACSTEIDRLLALPRAAKPAATTTDAREGEAWTTADGRIVRVVRSKQGNLYGLVYNAHVGTWDYQAGLLRLVQRRLSAEEAAEFGRTTAHCVFCARELTDGRSVDVGYGPVCAAHNGLPWG